MPPKADPYATKSARRVDAVLIVFTLLVIAFVLLTAPRHLTTDRRKLSPHPDTVLVRLVVNDPTDHSDRVDAEAK